MIGLAGPAHLLHNGSQRAPASVSTTIPLQGLNQNACASSAAHSEVSALVRVNELDELQYRAFNALPLRIPPRSSNRIDAAPALGPYTVYAPAMHQAKPRHSSNAPLILERGQICSHPRPGHTGVVICPCPTSSVYLTLHTVPHPHSISATLSYLYDTAQISRAIPVLS